MSIQELLSTALDHNGAKTTAFEDFMTVDVAVVILSHGGEVSGSKLWRDDCPGTSRI